MNFTTSNSEGQAELHEAWSPEARAASAAARKGRGQGFQARRALATEAYTKAGGLHSGVSAARRNLLRGTTNRPRRMKAPPSGGEHLSKDERAIDYGSVNDLMKQKYGSARGDKMYHGMIDNPSAGRGLHFVVGAKIQKEKKAMMRTLGYTGHPDSHHYMSLHSDWSRKTGNNPKPSKSKKPGSARSKSAAKMGNALTGVGWKAR